MIQLTQNSLELYSQLKNLTIHGPDIQGLIQATSNKRRLRSKYLNAEGNEDIFEVVRKAADEGEEIDLENISLLVIMENVILNILGKQFQDM